MDMDKEKAYRKALFRCKSRILWLAKQLVQRGYCVNNKQFFWECSPQKSCVLCWLEASERAANKAKDNG